VRTANSFARGLVGSASADSITEELTMPTPSINIVAEPAQNRRCLMDS
jgi:hypothetical protein